MAELEPVPVLAFGRPAIKLWTHAGLNCAIYWGRSSFNGYVQLPPGHVEREFAEAYTEVKRQDFEAEPDPLWRRFIPSGYDLVSAEAHGGLTYGPDEQGWVGFDTAHYMDDWSDEEIERWLRPVDEEAWLEFREMQLLIPDAWPAGRLTKKDGRLDYHPWTMEELIGEVEDVAAQLAALVRP